MRPLLSICAFLTSDLLIQPLKQAIRGELEVCGSLADGAAADPRFSESQGCRYTLNLFHHERKFLDFVHEEKRQIDCLVLQDAPDLSDLLAQLQQAALLPTLILVPTIASASTLAPSESTVMPEAAYHRATLRLSIDRLGQFNEAVDEVIDQFLQLGVNSEPLICDLGPAAFNPSLLLQQHRLAEKLKERLGYLGVYYKRNPQNFFRRMRQEQQQAFLQQLRADYREIVLVYFSNEAGLNERIDNFINLVFFADVAVAQIVEIHMELMDDISKQLRLEGRSDEVLLDYRLTLIDTIAHLCEMYRRSVPRES